MTLRKPKYDALVYDHLAQIVNDSYRITGDVRQTVKETEVLFDVVWEIVGHKDNYDFGEVEKD